MYMHVCMCVCMCVCVIFIIIIQLTHANIYRLYLAITKVVLYIVIELCPRYLEPCTYSYMIFV